MAFRIPDDSSTFRTRAERARMAGIERDRLQHNIVAMRITQREFEAEMQRWKDSMEWNMYLVALQILMALEQQRDDNAPNDPDEPWNDAFCTAVRWIPEARMFLEEMSIACIRSDRTCLQKGLKCAKAATVIAAGR